MRGFLLSLINLDRQHFYMKRLMIIPFLLLGPFAHTQQRVVAECTVTYAIAVEEDNTIDKELLASLKATTKTVYIKANDSRTDLVSPTFKQTVLYNKTSGSAVILREIGANKLMTKMDNARWASENKRYGGIKVTTTGETKTILGYECRKATIMLKDSSVYSLYYAPNLIPSVRDFEYQFRDIPGFVLEYEAQEPEGKKITYTATKINFSPVQLSRFEIPVSGYRLLD
jgi:GLPGLI family protein